VVQVLVIRPELSIPRCSSMRLTRRSSSISKSLSVGTPGSEATPSRSRARSSVVMPAEASATLDRSPAALLGRRRTPESVPSSTSGCSKEAPCERSVRRQAVCGYRSASATVGGCTDGRKRSAVELDADHLRVTRPRGRVTERLRQRVARAIGEQPACRMWPASTRCRGRPRIRPW
jgi:hypothetical protein